MFNECEYCGGPIRDEHGKRGGEYKDPVTREKVTCHLLCWCDEVKVAQMEEKVMPEYAPHELKTIAEDYAKLCAALVVLRDTALFPIPDDLPDDQRDQLVEDSKNPLSIIEAAKCVIVMLRIAVDLQDLQIDD
jgi:hypothetical protein